MWRVRSSPQQIRRLASLALCALGSAACTGGDGDDTSASWTAIQEDLPGALLSVWGTGPDDVWSVGADARDGQGPLVLHFDGTGWTRLTTGETGGTLWWVTGVPGGPIWMGGDGGVILRFDGAQFTRMQTPGTATVFGIWGASADDVWAVGGESDSAGGFIWRNDGGDTWVDVPLPASLPSGAVWKAFGLSADDLWFVGSGLSLHWDGQCLTPGDTGVGSSLFTVHGSAGRYAAVGGLATGILVEYEGSEWKDRTPQPAPAGLTGVCLSGDGGYAVGQYGSVYRRGPSGWTEVDGIPTIESLHGVWIDAFGGVWAVGGQTASFPLTRGTMIHMGDPVPVGGI